MGTDSNIINLTDQMADPFPTTMFYVNTFTKAMNGGKQFWAFRASTHDRLAELYKYIFPDEARKQRNFARNARRHRDECSEAGDWVSSYEEMSHPEIWGDEGRLSRAEVGDDCLLNTWLNYALVDAREGVTIK